MVPELRLLRYWLAVADERNVTRAAERLAISQPALSAAIMKLERQLDVVLLDRTHRVLRVTPAGELLTRGARPLLTAAEELRDSVRARDRAPVGRLSLGMSPTARYGIGHELLTACAARAAGIMLYPREDTTGALVRDLRDGQLDLAVLFCPANGFEAEVEQELLCEEPAVVHMRADHALAHRRAVPLEALRDETLLVASSADSSGFTERVVAMCRARGLQPRTRADPYPDLGLHAVREGLGIVVYVRSAFPPRLAGSAFVPLDPPTHFPFTLAWRRGSRSAALEAVLGVAGTLGV